MIEVASASVLEPIPIGKNCAAGAANIKGSVYSVADFSVLSGGRPIRKGKFLVLNPSIMVGSALLIEALSGMHESTALGEPIQDPSMAAMPSWITSCHQIGNDRYYVVDAALMAADARFSKLQSVDLQ